MASTRLKTDPKSRHDSLTRFQRWQDSKLQIPSPTKLDETPDRKADKTRRQNSKGDSSSSTPRQSIQNQQDIKQKQIPDITDKIPKWKLTQKRTRPKLTRQRRFQGRQDSKLARRQDSKIKQKQIPKLTWLKAEAKQTRQDSRRRHKARFQPTHHSRRLDAFL